MLVAGQIGIQVGQRPGCLTLAGLLPDTARRASYGAAGVARARSRYAWSRIATATLSSYDPLLPLAEAGTLEEEA